MKPIVLLPLVFVLGGLIGRFGPVEELRAYRRAAEEKAAQAPVRGPSNFASLVALANIPVTAAPADGPASETVQADSAVSNAAPVAAKKLAQPRRFDPADLRARIDEAAELWRTRVAIKRATAIENLGLDDAGAAAFDEALADMNERLRETMQTVADRLTEDGAEMTPELGVRLLGDLSTVVAEAYDSLGAAAEADRRCEISRLQIYEFVDPSVAEPLIDVQDLLK